MCIQAFLIPHFWRNNVQIHFTWDFVNPLSASNSVHVRTKAHHTNRTSAAAGLEKNEPQASTRKLPLALTVFLSHPLQVDFVSFLISEGQRSLMITHIEVHPTQGATRHFTLSSLMVKHREGKTHQRKTTIAPNTQRYPRLLPKGGAPFNNQTAGLGFLTFLNLKGARRNDWIGAEALLYKWQTHMCMWHWCVPDTQLHRLCPETVEQQQRCG